MSLEFLSPDAVAWSDGVMPVARSPMEGAARADGAQFEIRDGWNVAVAYGSSAELEERACRESAGWADVSHLGKLELQAPADQLRAIVAEAAGAGELQFGTATRSAGAWCCPLTPTRVLVICETAARPSLLQRLTEAATGAERANVVDVTSNFAALTLAGPQAREVFARFSALDLRPARTPVGALRPGSIGRQPAILIREAADRYLFLFGWATGEYVWSIVSDAARHLGGRPVGADALAAISAADPDRPAAEGARA